MKKNLIKIITILAILLIGIFPMSLSASNVKKTSSDIIRVGFYEYKPYYYINKKGEREGYYHELLELLTKEINIKFEYIDCDFSNAMKKLEDGEVDILLGANYSAERAKTFAYTDHYIGTETFGIYTNEDISYGKLSELEGLKFAFIENEANSKWILNFLQDKNINIKPISVSADRDLLKLLRDKEVDAITATIENEDVQVYKKIYEYSTGPVYLVGNRASANIVSKFNDELERYADLGISPIHELNEKYFGKNDSLENKNTLLLVTLFFILSIIIIFLIIKKMYPMAKKNRIQHAIRERMKENRYLIYYQPIVNPKSETIVGFEALLRYNHPTKGLLNPFDFLKEIEDNDMLYEVSIWILKKIIKDYKRIHKFDNMLENKFYISMNVSLKEIENKDFIDKIIKIIDKSNLENNSICLEILENVGISDLNKINDSIKKLRSSGFMIAIDDFGVEYSNLSILKKFEFDIIKLDKYFMNNIFEQSVRQEIMKFLSNISIITNKSLVAEGVENIEQRDMIKYIKNDRFYIQGYFYSKPVEIEMLKFLNFTSLNE